MDGYGAYLLAIGLLLGGLLSLGKVLPFLESRGWIQISGLGARGRRAVGSALLGVDTVLAPQVRHVARAREGVRAPKKHEGEPGGGADDGDTD
jgi:hypothetical protein